jgi:hypothetical protein
MDENRQDRISDENNT